MYCPEPLLQGLDEEQSTSGEPAREAAILHSTIGEPTMLLWTRKGRVRGKCTKSRRWTSCIQMSTSTSEAKEAQHVSPTGSDDPIQACWNPS
jgi:hypothetical protein